MKIGKYLSPEDHSSLFHNVPVRYLSDVRSYLHKKTESNRAKFKFRIVYRGPRKFDNRSQVSKQSYCLKKNATHFAVYVQV